MAGALLSAAASTSLSGPTLGEAAAGTLGDGHHNGAPPGQPSLIPRPKPGGQAAGSTSSKCNGSLTLSPPRCGAVPPAPPPKRADGNNGAHAAACCDASNGNPSGMTMLLLPPLPAKRTTKDRRTKNCIGNNGDNDRGNNKYRRGGLFNLSSSLSSLVLGHLVSNDIAIASLLLSGIAVPRINVWHHNSMRPRRRRISSKLTKKMTAEEKNDLMRKLLELDAEDDNNDKYVPPSPTLVYLTH